MCHTLHCLSTYLHAVGDYDTVLENTFWVLEKSWNLLWARQWQPVEMLIFTDKNTIICDRSDCVFSESLMRGWELLGICLSFFPPSFRFLTCIDSYISRSLDHASDQVVTHINTLPMESNTFPKSITILKSGHVGFEFRLYNYCTMTDGEICCWVFFASLNMIFNYSLLVCVELCTFKWLSWITVTIVASSFDPLLTDFPHGIHIWPMAGSLTCLVFASFVNKCLWCISLSTVVRV